LGKNKRNRNKQYPEQQKAAGARAASNDQPGEKGYDGERKKQPTDLLNQQSMLRRVIAWLDELTLQRLGLIVAAGLLIATWYQACLSRDTLRDSQRAFVYARDPFLIGDGGKPGEPSNKPAWLVVDLPNSGETPARKVATNLNYCATIGELPDDFSFPPSPLSQPELMLAPKSEGQTSVELPDTLFADLEKEARTLYVYGVISYEDIFDQWHQTEFCAQYRGYVLKTDGTMDKLVFAACKKHNCHDKDCPKSWGDAPCPMIGAKQIPMPSPN
jgi:hypothetical protein